MTVRLPEKDIKVVEELSSKEGTDKSTTIRELIELGKIYFTVLKYRDGKISIGKAAEIAGLSLSEMIDVLIKLGIKSGLEVTDYLEGFKNNGS